MKTQKLCSEHNRTIRIGLTIILTTVTLLLYAQTQQKTDSLLKVIKSNKADTLKIDALSNLFFIHEFSDTIKANLFLEQELSLSKKNDNSKWLANTYIHFGFFNEDKSDLTQAIEFHKKALKLFNENTFLKIKEKNRNISACYNNIALIYGKLGIYEKALDYYLLSLKMDEILGDNRGISISYSNIGIIHRKQGNYDKALDYYFKSLKIAEKLNDKNQMSSCYNNIGLAYQYKKDYKEAISFISKSLKIDEEFQDLNRLSSCYNNLGNVYLELSEYDKSFYYYNKALSIGYQIGDKNRQSSVLGNIAALNTKLKQYDDAIHNAAKSISIAKEIGVLPWQMSSYAILSETYDSLENYKKAYENQKLFKLINDSIYSIESGRQIKGMEAKYENEKKQLEIEKLAKEKELQLSENKKQRIVIWFVVFGLILLAVIAVLIFRSLRITRRQKRIIVQQKILVDESNVLLNQHNEEIRTQRDEIESQKDIVVKQKNELENIYEELTDSIVYAQRIQQAVLPMTDYLDQFLKEYFVFNKPKNIVSGDFFWITKVNTWTLFCVADCTGHGVPGAFMSMLGIALLNEIVRQENITQASHVLDQLRKRVIESLNQRGLTGEQQDGMDIAFCALNTDTFELQYAGANNPVYIITQFENLPAGRQGLKMNQFENDVASSNFQISKFPNLIGPVTELVEVKGDKMPISIHTNMQPFTNQICQLQKGDILYLMSDGFEDQFGGLNRKKFLAKNMKQLLMVNSQKPMANQKELLEKALIDWKGESEQIDDITIMGIKI